MWKYKPKSTRVTNLLCKLHELVEDIQGWKRFLEDETEEYIQRQQMINKFQSKLDELMVFLYTIEQEKKKTFSHWRVQTHLVRNQPCYIAYNKVPRGMKYAKTDDQCKTCPCLFKTRNDGTGDLVSCRYKKVSEVIYKKVCERNNIPVEYVKINV